MLELILSIHIFFLHFIYDHSFKYPDAVASLFYISIPDLSSKI